MILRLSILVLLFFTLSSCDSQQQQDDFEQSAGETASGYARTDSRGAIIDDDQDDWRTAPIYGGKVRFDPAYPNPATIDFVTIPVTVLEFNSIQGGLTLRARDANNVFRTLDDIVDSTDPGAYIFRFSPALLARTGLVRVFVFYRIGELVSYGDILIQ